LADKIRNLPSKKGGSSLERGEKKTQGTRGIQKKEDKVFFFGFSKKKNAQSLEKKGQKRNALSKP